MCSHPNWSGNVNNILKESIQKTKIEHLCKCDGYGSKGIFTS